MFIGFLSYTNDAVIEKYENLEMSMLDQTVFDALAIKMTDKEDCGLTRAKQRAVLPRTAGRGAEAETPVLEQKPAAPHFWQYDGH